MVLDLIQAQPKLGNNPYVFAGRGKGALGGMSKPKARLDQVSNVRDWVLHDLRRTARSLMSRAGVPGDYSERVMGHVIGGVEGVYDRFEYRDEKAEALRRLAGLIDAIINERIANVMPMRKTRK
jgi:integrase